MRRWFENRLAMLFAATYMAATERAMTALPHPANVNQNVPMASAASFLPSMLCLPFLPRRPAKLPSEELARRRKVLPHRPGVYGSPS